MTKILVVEDEAGISSFIAQGLEKEGMEAVVAQSGGAAIDLVLGDEFDLVILDIGLPDMDGFEVLKQIRGQGVTMPVIVLTARSSVEDTVAGLEGGADDYMPKPFRFEELVARIKLRIKQSGGANGNAENLITVGNLELDTRRRQAVADGKKVELSSREYTMLQAFMEHPDQVLSRTQLLEMVWGYGFDPGSNVIDVYVGYLRRKIGAKRIVTVRGMGYRLAII
ncbi:response regulator transcription factor [Winkia neuii]|uniref:response regulator transcription factor n=1 Tax=Winkia neuii TaxID=33007 RepID=UPI0004118F02|nr:response regulator transcription factor [Winkia neuii]